MLDNMLLTSSMSQLNADTKNFNLTLYEQEYEIRNDIPYFNYILVGSGMRGNIYGCGSDYDDYCHVYNKNYDDIESYHENFKDFIDKDLKRGFRIGLVVDFYTNFQVDEVYFSGYASQDQNDPKDAIEVINWQDNKFPDYNLIHFDEEDHNNSSDERIVRQFSGLDDNISQIDFIIIDGQADKRSASDSIRLEYTDRAETVDLTTPTYKTLYGTPKYHLDIRYAVQNDKSEEDEYCLRLENAVQVHAFGELFRDRKNQNLADSFVNELSLDDNLSTVPIRAIFACIDYVCQPFVVYDTSKDFSLQRKDVQKEE